MKDAFAVIVLAAGKGTRFGGDKLNAIVRNRPLYEHMLDKVQAFGAFPAFVVTGSQRIAKDAAKRGITPVENREPERGISHSLILGLKAALRYRPELRGVLFSVCDQPGIGIPTMQRIFNMALHHPGCIICAGNGKKTGNPVFWDRVYFSELMELTGDEGGRQVIRKHGDRLRVVQTDPEELKDIDRREDLW